MRFPFFLLAFPLLAIGAELQPVFTPPENGKIAFQNSILVKVNGKTISMMDVKKKLDLYFHKNYPQLINSSSAKYQFYTQSWRQVVMEMIDHELILADALDKEIKLTDGEVREEMENRFGPNTLVTLDKIGLTYEEALKMIKDEMMVQRMSWWFIQAKAMQKVTPDEIRQAYRQYLKNNPPYQEWKYRVVTVKGEEAEKAAEQVYSLLSQKGQSPDLVAEDLKALENGLLSIQVSNQITANDQDISEAYKTRLAPLAPGEYSSPFTKTSHSERLATARIFYCEEVSHHPAPSFEEMNARLRDELLQKALQNQSTAYIEKLRKQYGFDGNALKSVIPGDLEPFSIESF